MAFRNFIVMYNMCAIEMVFNMCEIGKPRKSFQRQIHDFSKEWAWFAGDGRRREYSHF